MDKTTMYEIKKSIKRQQEIIGRYTYKAKTAEERKYLDGKIDGLEIALRIIELYEN
nr:hypothetical protein DNLHUEGD_DNLHUEGD_CDS_0002 [Microvirus sp.]